MKTIIKLAIYILFLLISFSIDCLLNWKINGNEHVFLYLVLAFIAITEVIDLGEEIAIWVERRKK